MNRRRTSGPSGDRGVLEHGPLLLRERVEPGEHRRMDGVRKDDLLVEGPGALALLVRPNELASEERIAAGAIHDAVGHPSGDSLGEQVDELPRLVRAQRFEADGRKVAPPAAPLRTAIEEFRAGEGDHDERRRRTRQRHVLDEIEEAVAGPVEVLEHHHDRPASRECLDQQAPRGKELVPVALLGLGGAAEGRPDEPRETVGVGGRLSRGGERVAHPIDEVDLALDSEQAAREPAQGQVGDRGAVRKTLRGRDRDRRVAVEPGEELFDEPRLPGPRRGGDGHELRASLGERAPGHEGELREIRVSADERCARDGPRREPFLED